MQNEINAYLAHISAEYKRRYKGDSGCAHLTRMEEEFDSGLRFIDGSVYVKVLCKTSVHSFIVKTDGERFKRGDILKAASYKAPAKNFPRGNVFVPNSYVNVPWMGA